MPVRSKAQEAYLAIHHPEILSKWKAEGAKTSTSGLPQHVKKHATVMDLAGNVSRGTSHGVKTAEPDPDRDRNADDEGQMQTDKDVDYPKSENFFGHGRGAKGKKMNTVKDLLKKKAADTGADLGSALQGVRDNAKKTMGAIKPPPSPMAPEPAKMGHGEGAEKKGTEEREKHRFRDTVGGAALLPGIGAWRAPKGQKVRGLIRGELGGAAGGVVGGVGGGAAGAGLGALIGAALRHPEEGAQLGAMIGATGGSSVGGVMGRHKATEKYIHHEKKADPSESVGSAGMDSGKGLADAIGKVKTDAAAKIKEEKAPKPQVKMGPPIMPKTAGSAFTKMANRSDGMFFGKGAGRGDGMFFKQANEIEGDTPATFGDSLESNPASGAVGSGMGHGKGVKGGAEKKVQART